MPSKARLLAKSMIESPILSEITTNPTVTPSTITTAVDDVATGNFASIDLLPSTGNDVGDQAFVQATNRLYIWSGSGWYNIALINTTPTWDSGGQPNATYDLSSDSPQTATTITLAASDPEGFPITYSHVTGGSMDSMATISQDSSVFTITPKTAAQIPAGGTGSITFRATDGVNILPYVSSFTLSFTANYTLENDSYDGLSKDLNSGFGVPRGFVFNSDGTKIYVTTNLKLVVEYSMSTAYDIATASYVNDYNFGTAGANYDPDPGSLTIGDNYSKLWFTSYNSQKVHQLNFGSGSSAVSSLSYSSSNDYSFSSTQTTYGRGMLWNNNGTVFWLFNDTRNLYEYTTTNWNVSGASHNATISNHLPASGIRGAFWNDDGTKVFLNDYSRLKQYSVSTAYDLGSTLTYDDEMIILSTQRSSNYGGFLSGDFNRTSTTIGGTNIDAGSKIFSMWNSAPISGGTPYNGTRMFRYSVG